MKCCQCQAIELEFNQREAALKLKEYRRSGPAATTRLLLRALREAGVEGQTLLDIGGGIGAIQYDLLHAGARAALSVEASSAYLEAAQEEARRQGLADRIRFLHGNFVEHAADIPPADVVTLDRVICCYPDMPALVGLSAERARRLYALVYPRDAAWVRLGLRGENLLHRLMGSPFRAFAHRAAAVEAVLRERGLRRCVHRNAGFWQVAVYAR
jgi:magnesium-protoporphyrin O-methyltransferase